jgi:oligoendopeptidase F
MALDLDSYRERAERFLEELDREYLSHLAGHKAELEIDAIYERQADLFTREAVEALRDATTAVNGDEGRRRRYLLAFAFDAHLGQATKREAEEIAGLEASLEVEVQGGPVAYRQVQIQLANEPDAARRRALDESRNQLLAERINPLHLAAFERTAELCRALGWPSYAAAQAELRGIDLPALALQTRALLQATEGVYEGIVEPRLEAASLPPLAAAGREDVPRLLRAPELDALFPRERLFDSFTATLAGLGLDLDAQANVHLDAESRPTKSPRAFCFPVEVPGEVYLMFAPVGGAEDYRALYHEGGHTEHYANTDAALPFEFRHLGDNSVTESFAFLLEHVTESPAWMSRFLGADGIADAVAHARASKLLFVRRYAAKLDYELELHGEAADLEHMPARYAELVGDATRLRWPTQPWLDDVDGGFYVACYLRAWALEAHWRLALEERYGERWFEEAEAGEWLRRLWAQGQRLAAGELLGEELGIELDFEVLGREFA